MQQNAISLAEVTRALAQRMEKVFPIKHVRFNPLSERPSVGDGMLQIEPQDSRYSPFVVRYFGLEREAVIHTDKGAIPEAFAERLRREYVVKFPAVDVSVNVREEPHDPTQGLRADIILHSVY